MNMNARNQYLKTLIYENKGYHLCSKKEKAALLDEYCKNTSQNRKYVIRKIRNASYLNKERKKRTEYYDSYVQEALIQCWEIFDRPSGQRLKPLLEDEVDRLRGQRELNCSTGVALKLKEISARTIDEKLTRHKEQEKLKQKYKPKIHPLLYQKIPVKIFSEQDRDVPGNVQIDFVEHCGASAKGQYINSLSTTDINFGWWEGEAIMGLGQKRTQEAISQLRFRYPFDWLEIHSDNGTPFINHHLYNYTLEEGLKFSRSRPYQKNNNCLVEQKNWTHIKKHVGYLRYDKEEELIILNDLYANEFHLFKNFFQPVMKLASKERLGAKIKRKYDKAKTPYQRVLESNDIPRETKKELTRIYNSLNPAELKRNIDKKLNNLWKAYENKQKAPKEINITKKIKPCMVTYYIAQPEAVRLPSYIA